MIERLTCLSTRRLVNKLQPRALAQIRSGGHYEGIAASRVQDHVDVLARRADGHAGVVSTAGDIVDQRLSEGRPPGQARVASSDGTG